MLNHKPDHFKYFNSDINGIALPKRFTFPFYYEPHPLCLIAAKEVQGYLENQQEWEHNFGLNPGAKGLIIGKMFGVLVVQTKKGELGFLAAVSGKLAGVNTLEYFVPPIFDMLTRDGFFKKEEEILNAINRKIEVLESNPQKAETEAFVQEEEQLAQGELLALKQQMKAAKKSRKTCRTNALSELAPQHLQSLEEELIKESLNDKFILKDQTRYWEKRLETSRKKRDQFRAEIQRLKEERKARSASLQKKLFDQYHFLNIDQKTKSVLDIFEFAPNGRPPAGAGECAAPKLLQYAFTHQLKPIAMAEFWWGASPKSEIRKHKQFYPACRGKCEPILTHMLEGMSVDPNPMLENPAKGKELEIIYEDDNLLAVHKPAEFLSVPGKNVTDSVQTRMQLLYPDATGPLIVHRLDMSTSGVMLIAKNKAVHEKLQQQFIQRTIKKRYVALLDGIVNGKEGFIDLPLRVDLDNRPQQLVCYEHGKTAQTKWELISTSKGKSRIYFYPITGRTHQLRVHAAHASGLNCSIKGDDLYGTKGSRLHLHAEQIEFFHPVKKERMKIRVKAEF